MEIYDVLRSAPAQVMFILPLHLESLRGAHQNHTFGLLFGAVEQKDLVMWQFLVAVFGSPGLVPYYGLPAGCGLPLVDYAD